MASKAYKRLMKKIPQQIKDKVDIDIDYLDNQEKELKEILIKSWTETNSNKDFFKELTNNLISRGVRVKTEDITIERLKANEL